MHLITQTNNTMENLKMVSFSTDEIQTEIIEALDGLSVFTLEDCSDKIYVGEIFHNLHPDNDPSSDFSEEAIEALESLMELTEDASYVMIWLA